MARYWNEMNYPQPTEEELKENAKNTRKKSGGKGTDAAPDCDKISTNRQQLVGKGMVPKSGALRRL